VIGKTQMLQSVVEGIPDIIRCFLRDDFAEVAIPVFGDTPQGTGAEHNPSCQPKETALPGAKHSINTLTEHPGYDQTEGGGRKKAY